MEKVRRGSVSLPLIFLVAVVSLVSYASLSLLRAKSELKVKVWSKYKSRDSVVEGTPTYSTVRKPEEIEKLLVHYCEYGRAMIIRCQECYASGRTYCPYPTDAFCQTARGANYNDPNIVWGFLPSTSGNVKDIVGAYSKDINSLTSIYQIPAGIRWLIKREYSADYFEDYRYRRPTTAGTDPCAVEGIVCR